MVRLVALTSMNRSDSDDVAKNLLGFHALSTRVMGERRTAPQSQRSAFKVGLGSAREALTKESQSSVRIPSKVITPTDVL